MDSTQAPKKVLGQKNSNKCLDNDASTVKHTAKKAKVSSSNEKRTNVFKR